MKILRAIGCRLLRTPADPLHDPKRQRGVTMIEALLGLGVIATVTVAGFLTYSEVAVRQEANKFLSSMQGFLVDTRQYLESYHSEGIGGVTEVTLSGDAQNIKAFGGTSTAGTESGVAGVLGTTISCRAAGVPHPQCTCATYPCNGANLSNPNMTRFLAMPSLKFGHGSYDGDGKQELHIPVGKSEALELELELVPPPAGSSIGGGTAKWADCEFVDTNAKPDTALTVHVPLNDFSVCENMAEKNTLHGTCTKRLLPWWRNGHTLRSPSRPRRHEGSGAVHLLRSDALNEPLQNSVLWWVRCLGLGLGLWGNVHRG